MCKNALGCNGFDMFHALRATRVCCRQKSLPTAENCTQISISHIIDFQSDCRIESKFQMSIYVRNRLDSAVKAHFVLNLRKCLQCIRNSLQIFRLTHGKTVYLFRFTRKFLVLSSTNKDFTRGEGSVKSQLYKDGSESYFGISCD